MYKLRRSSYFKRKYRKITKGNQSFKVRIVKVLGMLSTDPFHPSLRTHKIITSRNRKEAWSSRVSGDYRIIWRFEGKTVEVIQLLDIGGHSGGRSVYK
ncbi:type II toxin-antitoxin system mRNA interferase toxin, RelE/StbE family [Candidatus Dojkabacteria bacterium]|nr:type II toxin-antitoxin system mRNA interferase toxin, RelE/StbE family [Candidatus Dojkabacteria bacterium]